jgi:hypothetical protein
LLRWLPGTIQGVANYGTADQRFGRTKDRVRAGSTGRAGRSLVRIRLAGSLDTAPLLCRKRKPLGRFRERRYVWQPEYSVREVPCQRKSSQ